MNTSPAALEVEPQLDLRKYHLLDRYRAVRAFSAKLCETLCVEDYIGQSMPDASPMRWHLAHTTWFFETFILTRNPGYRKFNDAFEYLFNSYYNSVGEQFPREQRGLLTRPTVEEINCYRKSVDEMMLETLQQVAPGSEEILDIVELGLNHEQQHQELMQTDIKHLFAQNPMFPSLSLCKPATSDLPSERQWVDYEEGVH